jgi:phospholipid/cholesterol/gamma-HCH transport system substrate-binding protein
MRKTWSLELATGIFLIMGLLALGYLSIRLARMEVVGQGGYTLYARFSSVEGLKDGGVVEIAGVEVGRVKSIDLEDYQARVGFSIRKDVKVPDDTIVSVRTKGLLGEKYVRLSPGGSGKYLPPGGEIFDTEAPIDLEQLIANFIFGKI